MPYACAHACANFLACLSPSRSLGGLFDGQAETRKDVKRLAQLVAGQRQSNGSQDVDHVCWFVTDALKRWV